MVSWDNSPICLILTNFTNVAAGTCTMAVQGSVGNYFIVNQCYHWDYPVMNQSQNY
jgi:hypothetical protein